jgi:hypothetical protein
MAAVGVRWLGGEAYLSKVIVDMAVSLDGFVATADGRDAGLHDYSIQKGRSEDVGITSDAPAPGRHRS